MNNFSTEPSMVSSSSQTTNQSDTVINAVNLLQVGTVKQQLSAIETLMAMGDVGYPALIDFLRTSQSKGGAQVCQGKVYQGLSRINHPLVKSFLETELPNGVVALGNSGEEVGFRDLQRALIDQNYKVADQLTLQKICELAGPDAVARKWVYFTEVDAMSVADLQVIDLLWRVYSEDKFGFSKQRELWLSLNRNWDRLWDKMAWKSGNTWTRYPGEFIWDLSAPIGHLPLSNQLRGVRMMESLLSHRAWHSSE